VFLPALLVSLAEEIPAILLLKKISLRCPVTVSYTAGEDVDAGHLGAVNGLRY
jgi:hypothetical protein